MLHELIAKLMLIPIAMLLVSFAIPVREAESHERSQTTGTEVIVSDLLNDTARR